MHTIILLLALLSLTLVAPASADAPGHCKNTTPDSPKYKPGTCHELIGGDSRCIARCSSGPMRLTPVKIEGCEGQPIQVNLRVDGGRMDNYGDTVQNAGGFIDWGDGIEEGLNATACCNWNLTHTYVQAKTYYPSATFGAQYTNANNPRGGCSYRCRLQAASPATIYLKSSPQCKTGTFKKEQ